MVDGDQVDEALDHERTAALVVDVLLEDEAEIRAGLDGRADLDDISELGAFFEGHLGLVDHKTNALFVVETDELIGADEVFATYSGGTYFGTLVGAP